MPAVLITQCLQHDFVQRIGRYDPLPNLLHIGFEEARRLMGEIPGEGPLDRLMSWAYDQPDEHLRLVHIRDWHDAADPAQHSHFALFGEHCVRDTPGAALVFEVPANAGKAVELVDALTLNDFQDTRLDQALRPLLQTPTRVGLIGVWTEAKILFLAYELRTRYPQAELAVCSALTASSSRNNHFLALTQLQRLLGVRVIPSLGEFIEYLGGTAADMPLLGLAELSPTLIGAEQLSEPDRQLLRYLFRDCRQVKVSPLSGGFSGNAVLGTESEDLERRSQVPHVVKIGARGPIGRERSSFEQIEAVLGNAAPRIADFADLGDRGAIKYRYASMGGTFSTTFQKLYQAGLPQADVERVLATVFGEQLMRLYRAAEREPADLLEYYCFSSQFAAGVRRRVEGLIGGPATADELTIVPGLTTSNLCRFYEETLDQLPRQRSRSHYFGYLHGDLNGANIVLDSNRNVWLIDFFHTHRGHILKDLIKLENDVLYIYTPVNSEAELRAAARLTDLLLTVADLAKPLPPPDAFGITSPELCRAHATVAALRGFYGELIKSDRDPLQVYIGMLRYAVHTLGFDECNDWQRRWALYTAGRCVDKITHRLSAAGPLRVDWLPGERLGITLLPGRRDFGRDLADDIATLRQVGVTDVLVLLTPEELDGYGVEDLIDGYTSAGLHVLHRPILDQKGASPEQLAMSVDWINQRLEGGGKVLVHCAAGLGRSGMVAACWLRRQGVDAATAIATVRRARSPRAIETAEQEQAVAEFY